MRLDQAIAEKFRDAFAKLRAVPYHRRKLQRVLRKLAARPLRVRRKARDRGRKIVTCRRTAARLRQQRPRRAAGERRAGDDGGDGPPHRARPLQRGRVRP